jgi:ribose 5-phosphate isomerase
MFIRDGMTVGIDSGDYCTSALQEIGKRLSSGELSGVKVIASCDAAASEAAFVGVPQAMSADTPQV